MNITEAVTAAQAVLAAHPEGHTLHLIGSSGFAGGISVLAMVRCTPTVDDDEAGDDETDDDLVDDDETDDDLVGLGLFDRGELFDIWHAATDLVPDANAWSHVLVTTAGAVTAAGVELAL